MLPADMPRGPAIPYLASLAMLGIGVAGAVSPYPLP